jgi:6-pyruvoyltetrahydropterin/6-carboxytetrahydropterin synthase
MSIEAVRYHDISCGHRVSGHESKCAHLHGHNYRIWFYCRQLEGGLDSLGRVIDFSDIKNLLCDWLELNWDHKFLAWDEDVVMQYISATIFQQRNRGLESERVTQSIVWVPFNPTAENIGIYLINVVGPRELAGSGIILTKVVVEETRKCSAIVSGGTNLFGL